MSSKNIYELIEEYQNSKLASEQIVAAIMDELNGRSGIDQMLQQIEDDTMEEIFTTLIEEAKAIIDNHFGN